MFRYLEYSQEKAVWGLIAFAIMFALMGFFPEHAMPAVQAVLGGRPQQAMFKATFVMFAVSAVAVLLGDYAAYRQAAQGSKWKYVLLVQVLLGGKDAMTLSLGAAAVASWFIYGLIIPFVLLIWVVVALMCAMTRSGERHLVPFGAVLLGIVVLFATPPGESLGIHPSLIVVVGLGAIAALYTANNLAFRRWQIAFYDL